MFLLDDGIWTENGTFDNLNIMSFWKSRALAWCTNKWCIYTYVENLSPLYTDLWEHNKGMWVFLIYVCMY